LSGLTEETDRMSRKTTRQTRFAIRPAAMLGQVLLNLAEACRDIRATARTG
jgi:hypothetical protein